MYENEKLIREIIETRHEIESAQISFNNAESPELTDYFIYKLYSAERKYDCLLKLAKQRNIKEKNHIVKISTAV